MTQPTIISADEITAALTQAGVRDVVGIGSENGDIACSFKLRDGTPVTHCVTSPSDAPLAESIELLKIMVEDAREEDDGYYELSKLYADGKIGSRFLLDLTKLDEDVTMRIIKQGDKIAKHTSPDVSLSS